jgi:glycosyltransferase involved in cell wall biosynthesis
MKKPFHIALIMQGGYAWIGGIEYIRNIILALGSLPAEVRATFEVSLVTNSHTESNFISSIKPFVKKIYTVEADASPRLFERIKRTIKTRFLKQPGYNVFDLFLRSHEFDFVYPYHSPLCRRSLKNVAAWIYDFQHKYLPQFFSEQEIRVRDERFSDMAEHASMIVLSSKSAETDFKKFYPEAANKARILSFRTVPQSSWYEGDSEHVQQKYFLPDKFFILSNQFWQHKNHLVVFRAMKLLRGNGVKPVVVCTGHIYDYRQPDFSDNILQTIHKSGLTEQVFLLGLIPKSDQIQLLRRAIALIQPSLFEGWSTVIEEARCMGKPMILSDFPVHLEQNPPKSKYFEKMSSKSLAPIMAEYWQKFSPGPDLELESIAREINKEEVQTFAYEFLNIAKAR